jgi:hypothetical protein
MSNGNDNNITTQPAAEFQALPLDTIVSAPLTAAVKAQRAAAEATKQFIESMIKDDEPVMVDFKIDHTDDEGNTTTSVKAPLLSLVPVPHLRIDKLTIDFVYEVSQTRMSEEARSKSLDLDVSAGPPLPWLKASLKGSISSESRSKSTMNRSGELRIHVSASESPIPEGLSRILSLLARSVPIGKEEGDGDS